MDLARLVAFCGHLSAAGGGTVPLALLLAGLSGSVVHCGAMCGPFVLAQAAGRAAAVPVARLCERTRIANALLVPYHAGRLLTYAGLGGLAASLGSRVAMLPGCHWLTAALLAGAGVMFAAQGLKPLLQGRTAPSPFGHRLAGLAGRFDRTRWTGTFALGLVLGLLPCGFLYAALAVAAASGGPLAGAAAMAGFGLGTVPALVAVGLAGQVAARRFGRISALAMPVVAAVNAVLLFALAGHRIGLL